MAISPTDLIDYVLQFDVPATAATDPITGPFFTAPPLPGFPVRQIALYRNRFVNTVTPEAGFWIMLTTRGVDPALANHGNIQIVNDLTAMTTGGVPSAISATFDVSNVVIIINNSGATYTSNGLQLMG